MKKKLSVISRAFKTLRQNGYFAKQNFWCCNSCAWYDVPEERADKVVFYHSQDYSTLKKEDRVYLTWSGDGNEIVQAFIDNGLPKHEVDWDGTEQRRIVINNVSCY